MFPSLRADVSAIHSDWENIGDRYNKWYHVVFVNEERYTPTPEQVSVLHMVHKRTKYEYFMLRDLPLPEDLADMSPVPECKLRHGLPEVGKYRVFKWI